MSTKDEHTQPEWAKKKSEKEIKKVFNIKPDSITKLNLQRDPRIGNFGKIMFLDGTGHMTLDLTICGPLGEHGKHLTDDDFIIETSADIYSALPRLKNPGQDRINKEYEKLEIAILKDASLVKDVNGVTHTKYESLDEREYLVWDKGPKSAFKAARDQARETFERKEGGKKGKTFKFEKTLKDFYSDEESEYANKIADALEKGGFEKRKEAIPKNYETLVGVGVTSSQHKLALGNANPLTLSQAMDLAGQMALKTLRGENLDGETKKKFDSLQNAVQVERAKSAQLEAEVERLKQITTKFAEKDAKLQANDAWGGGKKPPNTPPPAPPVSDDADLCYKAYQEQTALARYWFKVAENAFVKNKKQFDELIKSAPEEPTDPRL